MTPIFHLSNHA